MVKVIHRLHFSCCHEQGGLAGGWEFRLIFTFILFLVLALIASIFLANLAIRPIKEAWKKQLDFTADASHELRTPLAVMQTSLEIIMDNKEQLFVILVDNAVKYMGRPGTIMLESHEGKIWIESKKGEGTCFTIWLPWNTIGIQHVM